MLLILRHLHCLFFVIAKNYDALSTKSLQNQRDICLLSHTDFRYKYCQLYEAIVWVSQYVSIFSQNSADNFAWGMGSVLRSSPPFTPRKACKFWQCFNFAFYGIIQPSVIPYSDHITCISTFRGFLLVLDQRCSLK